MFSWFGIWIATVIIGSLSVISLILCIGLAFRKLREKFYQNGYEVGCEEGFDQGFMTGISKSGVYSRDSKRIKKAFLDDLFDTRVGGILAIDNALTLIGASSISDMIPTVRQKLDKLFVDDKKRWQVQAQMWAPLLLSVKRDLEGMTPQNFLEYLKRLISIASDIPSIIKHIGQTVGEAQNSISSTEKKNE